MTWARPALTGLLLAGCIDPAPAVPLTPNEVAGDVVVDELIFDVVDGLAYGGSPAHGGVVVRLSDGLLDDCALPSEGLSLELPADAGAQRASVWSCDDAACHTIAYPLAHVRLTEVGSAVGERVIGEVELLDDAGEVIGSAHYDLAYCGLL